MVKESGGSDTAPSTPVQGSVGKAGDAVLGDRAKPRFRYFLATSETSGGIVQAELVFAYTFTS